MIIDSQNLFSDAQALSATGASTNLIDLGAERRIGSGEPMAAVVTVDVALAGTSPTFAITVQSDDNSGFSSAATVVTSATISGAANAPAGAKFVVPIPSGLATERYVRLNYTLGGTTPTITVTAFLQPMSMIQNDAYYADALTIS